MDCSEKTYAKSVPYVAVLSVRALLSLAGAIFIALDFKRELSRRSHHHNEMTVLLLHYFVTIISALSSIGFSAKLIYDCGSTPLTIQNDIIENETLFPGVDTAEIFAYFFVFGNISGMMTVLSMAIERACSTIKADQYEKNSIRLGMVLAAISVFVGLGNASLFIFGIDMTVVGLVVLGVLVIGEFVIIGIFIALYVYNVRWQKSKARTLATLSHKYQVEENIESVLNLLPLASANAVCNLVSAICTLLSLIDPLAELPKVYFDITPLYFIALPIITSWRRRAARRWKESRAKQNQVKSNKETSGHFQILRSLFNTETVHETDDGHF